MKNSTNIEGIRKINKWLYDIFPIEDVYGGFLCSHPYYSTLQVPTYKDFGLLNLLNEEDKIIAREQTFEHIDNSDLIHCYMLIREPYKLLWVRECMPYMSDIDFAQYLADAWVVEENPNMDVNVKRKECLEMFKKAKKEYLMTVEDLAYYNNLPEEVTIWRGVSPNRVKLGLSWTDDYDKAVWFQHRFENMTGEKGRLYQATTKKNNIIAYFNTRGEAELLTDVFKVQRKIIEITV